ncbi:MAG TPA: efflux RND transporter periplasmic adaptor subunit [Terriglobales bacterium]|nr:efflux RND transporter periplasmic adaptor subunit [Terriglobales bacterium]
MKMTEPETSTVQPHQERHRRPPEIEHCPDLPPASTRQAKLIVVVVLSVLLFAGAIAMVDRVLERQALAKETEKNSVPSVVAVHPVAEPPEEQLLLPGTLQAYEESPIYARTSGYVRRWFKDIGSRVKQGELLAQIDTPELDQELSQARAARQQVQAQLQLAQISSQRWENLRKSDSVSQQEADQQTSGYQQSQANLAAADANVRRLEQLESFKNVYAPFSGVVTRRNVDPGVLINAGAGGREMFDVAKVDTLRVYVDVPQTYSLAVKTGTKATITLQEIPGEKFAGQVTRTANAIDPVTRTLRTEVDVPNAQGQLLPGSFGQVHFDVASYTPEARKVTVPVNAMLFRAEGPRVAVVGNDNKVQLRPITIGRDYGSALEVVSGLSAEDRVIINPSDSLEDGQQVNVAASNPGELKK